VVSGHYDSLARALGQGADDDRPAPGVNDDGSGTAAVLELARVFSRYDFEASLAFIAFDGEELGLVGSSLFSQKARREGMRIDAVLNNDIIGNEIGGDGLVDNSIVNCFSEGPEDSLSRQLARYLKQVGELYVPSMQVRLVFRHDRFGRGGDHTPFNQEGYAALRLTVSRENYANRHSVSDTFEGVSLPYCARVTRLNAAALASLALAPPAPRVTSPEGRLLLDRGESGYDARLRWSLPDAPDDLSGFAVVMRESTSPYWQKVFWVDQATELVLKNVSIDVYTFGVKAVDRDGNESLVTAYVNPPRQRTVYEVY
jgi:hypothetical protein